VTAWLRRFLGLRHYDVTVRMEWNDGDWVKTTADADKMKIAFPGHFYTRPF
jgi:hypothetical protein